MENSLKVLFAGCGDIGIRTISRLQNLGSDNTWKTLGMRRDLAKLPVGIDAVAGDVRDSERLGELLDIQNIDVFVVTLTPNQMSDEGYRESYVAAAQSIESAIKKCSQPPGLIVWVSSTGVYGQNNGEWVNEMAAVHPVSFRGKRLLEAEDVINSLPITSIIVRFSGIYGPGRNRLINQVRKGESVPELPVSWTNRIHAEDCAGVIVHLLECFRCDEHLDPYYIATDNEPAPAFEVRKWMANEMGIQFNEIVQAELGAKILSGVSADVSGRRCSNQRLRDSGYKFLYPTYRDGYRALLDDVPDE